MTTPRRSAWLGAAVAGCAVAGAYWRTRHAPWVLDDWQSVVANPTIRDLRRLGSVLTPDSGTTAGRPLLNLSFALNYAWGGTDPAGYHLANLVIHLLAAWLLYRLLAFVCGRVGLSEGWAAAAAALWALHPLHTEAVTYVSQRAESMMGALYLLMLVALARGNLLVSAAACWCGMATKETMVTAPVVALLFDRAFVARSWTGIRARRGYYASLAGSWILLGWLMTAFPIRDRAVGFGAGVSPLRYALTEAGAIARYLSLAVWPGKLVFDYGPNVLATVGSGVLLPVALVAALAIGTVALWRRSPAAGFAPAAFLLLLAPTSSFVPIALQPIAESRMYLPLAAMLGGLVLALGRLGAAQAGADAATRRRIALGGLIAAVAAGVLLGVTTWRRNAVYGSAEGLWRDTVAKAPANPRAHNSLGTLLAQEGRAAAAEAEFAAAAAADPSYAPAHYNWGVSLLNRGQARAAIPHLQLGLAAPQQRAEARLYLGQALLQEGRFAEAVPPLREAAALWPDSLEARFDLANALFGADRPNEAVAEYDAALRLRPGDPTLLEYRRRALLSSAGR